MNKKIKIFICGMGNLGKLIYKYAISKGYEIVGFYDIKIDEIKKCEDYINGNIAVSCVKELKEGLKKAKPDVCVITTSYVIKNEQDIYIACLDLGINVITTCEEAFYPYNSNKELAEELDKYAKENNCTIMGTGYQDVFWGQLVGIAASSLNQIIQIKGKSYYNIDGCNEEINLNHGVGLSLKEYKEKIQIKDDVNSFIPSVMWNVNGWICAKLELEITKSVQCRKPVIARKDIYSKALNKTIKKGTVIGTNTIVNTYTKEGIKIETSNIGMIFYNNIRAKADWVFYGGSNIGITINTTNAMENTAAITVNRIEDVIDSLPGFVTTDKIKNSRYIKDSINIDIKKEIK